MKNDQLYLSTIQECIAAVESYPRDILIHNYLRVDLEEIWRIVENELPVLKHQIDHIINNSRLFEL